MISYWLNRNKCKWDFNIAAGEAIKAKYSFMYINVYEWDRFVAYEREKMKSISDWYETLKKKKI